MFHFENRGAGLRRKIMRVVAFGCIAAGLAILPAQAQRTSLADINNTLQSVKTTVEANNALLSGGTPGAAASPLNIEGIFSFGTSVTLSNISGFYTVPAGKRLMIETIAVWTLTASCPFFLSTIVGTVSGGNFARFRLNTPNRVFSNLFGGFYNHQQTFPVRIYADPGSAVLVELSRSATGCGSDGRVTMSGLLVDAN